MWRRNSELPPGCKKKQIRIQRGVTRGRGEMPGSQPCFVLDSYFWPSTLEEEGVRTPQVEAFKCEGPHTSDSPPSPPSPTAQVLPVPQPSPAGFVPGLGTWGLNSVLGLWSSASLGLRKVRVCRAKTGVELPGVRRPSIGLAVSQYPGVVA